MGEFNNVWHTLKQRRECGCSFDMKLKLEEDKVGNVHYNYICTNAKCAKSILVEREDSADGSQL
jgi:hypothetical protein